MSARRRKAWCVSTHVDLPGDLSALVVAETEDADLIEFIRQKLADPNTLSITVFAREGKAAILEELRRQSSGVCPHDGGTVN